MVKIDGLGKNCPIPLVMTRKAVKALTALDTVQVLVDNTMAVSNIETFAKENGFKFTTKQIEDKKYEIEVVVDEIKKDLKETEAKSCEVNMDNKSNIVVQIGSNKMGCGDEKLGTNLLKAFIFSLTQAEVKPKTILFYNSGAYLTCEGSLSLEDLNNLKDMGVKILTCGTCLDFYGLKEKLKVGEVTNMYDIVTYLEGASLVIRP